MHGSLDIVIRLCAPTECDGTEKRSMSYKTIYSETEFRVTSTDEILGFNCKFYIAHIYNDKGFVSIIISAVGGPLLDVVLQVVSVGSGLDPL